MHRHRILDQLNVYRSSFPKEAKTISRFETFIAQNANCFERQNKSGHLTGSAWIVDKSYSEVVLVHHGKLNVWIQPGGHADGNSDLIAVARMEAHEETGLTSLQLLSNNIFDLCIHQIPAFGIEPEHYHYDIRYLFKSDLPEPLICSSESHSLAWVKLDEIAQKNSSESILRMTGKTTTEKLRS